MNLPKHIFYFCLLIGFVGHSQIDINRCREEVRENFSPRVFNVGKNRLLSNSSNANTIYVQHKNDLKIFSFNGNGVVTAVTDEKYKRIAISYYINTIHIYNIKTLDTIKKIELDEKSSSLTLKEDALFYGLDNGLVKKYDIVTQKEKTITQHKNIIRGLNVLNDGTVLSISNDGVLKINQPQKEERQKVFPKVLTSMTISPNEKNVAIGTFDGSVYILNDNYKIIKELTPHTSVITKLKFKNNQELISSSFDKKLVNSNIITKKMKLMYTSKDYIMAFDINEDQLIFSDRSGNVKFYNLNCQ